METRYQREMEKQNGFDSQYIIAKKKIELRLWTVEYAKGYLYCYLGNVLEVNDFLYDEYSKLIDELG